MLIVDPKTGKRLIDSDRNQLKELKKKDPVKRNAEKGLEGVEQSPMDPPDAYHTPDTVKTVKPEDMSALLKDFMEEHKEALQQIDAFEKALSQFYEFGYKFDEKINEAFGTFFEFFDTKLITHNLKEEKSLFPLLHQRLLESGEHSSANPPKTAIDLMEDDHVKFIQLGTLTFNMLGLATRLSDEQSRLTVFDVAYNNGRELIEMLKLHIFREDHTLFPLAQKLISEMEFSEIKDKIRKFDV